MQAADLLVGTSASLLARTDMPSASVVASWHKDIDWDGVGLVVVDGTPWPSPTFRRDLLQTAASKGKRILEYSPHDAGPVTAPGAIDPRGLGPGRPEVVLASSVPPGWSPNDSLESRLKARFGISSLPEPVNLMTSLFAEGGGGPDLSSVIGKLGHQSLVLISESMFPSHISAAASALSMSLRGIPVLLERTPLLRSILHDSYLSATDPAFYTDVPIERELLSSVQRVIAHRHHGPRVAAWLLRGHPKTFWPSVSVLIPTNRPEKAAHLAEQVARQTYERCEVVLIIHGDSYPDSAVKKLSTRLGPRELKIVRVPSSSNLGEALNQGAALCEGSYILKWDDDDFYSPNHIWDLVIAATYSGAEITAKAAEFVFLERLGMTMRRFAIGQERPQNTVAGGTLLVDGNAFRHSAGFPLSRSAVDVGLISGIQKIGGAVFRTHGFGYVLIRSESGHTWDPGIDYFLEQSSEQWIGLELEVSGIAIPEGLRPRE